MPSHVASAAFRLVSGARSDFPILHNPGMSADELESSVLPCDQVSTISKDWIMKSKEENIKLEKPEERLSEGSSADESEEVEPEPPPAAVRRKVSFADAFGLDLVSVKEYDSRDASGPDGREREEYYISCLFTIPDFKQDEDVEKLRQQKLQLERIELLPRSTTIRGIIRVLNLCFHKAVYVRATLDGWQSYFELLAEYMPGSSDGKTDFFSFHLVLTPPLPVHGVRVEFCLRYESAVGTYWANNGETNYIVFCYQRRRSGLKEKEKEKDAEKEKLAEESKGIRSCLKAISKKIYTDATPAETSGDISAQATPRVGHTGENKTEKESGITSCKSLKDCCKTLVARRHKRQAARLAHVKDYFAQKVKQTQTGYDSNADESTTSTPKLRIPSRTDLPVAHSRHGDSVDKPPILMYHHIPLLSLDWGSNTSTPHENTTDVYNKTTHKAEDHLSKSTSDVWEAFLNGTDAQDQACRSLRQVSRDNVTVPLEDTGSEKDCSQGSADWKATGTIKSDPTEQSNDPNTSSSSDRVVDYQPIGRDPSATTVPCSALGTEPERLGREMESEGQAPHHEHMSGSLSQDTIEANPGDKTQSARNTEPQNSEAGDGISPEECTGSSDTSKVTENTHRAVKDTLTFSGIRDTNRQAKGASSEKKDINKDDSEEQVEMRHFYTELHEEDKESGQDEKTMDHSTEMPSVSLCKSEAFNESELCTSNKNLNKDNSELQKSEEKCFEANEVLEMKEHLNETTIEERVEDKMCVETTPEVVEDSRAEAEDRTSEEEEGFESLKATNCSPTVSIDPSKEFLRTKEREPAEEDYELGMALRNFDEHQRLDAEDEIPAPLASIHLSCVAGDSSRLLSWRQEFNSLGPVAKTLVYVILFVIFITAYLYDMPACLALYLFSLCWWCSQGMKQRLDRTAVDVD